MRTSACGFYGTIDSASSTSAFAAAAAAAATAVQESCASPSGMCLSSFSFMAVRLGLVDREVRPQEIYSGGFATREDRRRIEANQVGGSLSNAGQKVVRQNRSNFTLYGVASEAGQEVPKPLQQQKPHFHYKFKTRGELRRTSGHGKGGDFLKQGTPLRPISPMPSSL